MLFSYFAFSEKHTSYVFIGRKDCLISKSFRRTQIGCVLWSKRRERSDEAIGKCLHSFFVSLSPPPCDSSLPPPHDPPLSPPHHLSLSSSLRCIISGCTLSRFTFLVSPSSNEGENRNRNEAEIFVTLVWSFPCIRIFKVWDMNRHWLFFEHLLLSLFLKSYAEWNRRPEASNFSYKLATSPLQLKVQSQSPHKGLWLHCWPYQPCVPPT